MCILEGSISTRGATLSNSLATPARGCAPALGASAAAGVGVENLRIPIREICGFPLRVHWRSARTPTDLASISWAAAPGPAVLYAAHLHQRDHANVIRTSSAGDLEVKCPLW